MSALQRYFALKIKFCVCIGKVYIKRQVYPTRIDVKRVQKPYFSACPRTLKCQMQLANSWNLFFVPKSTRVAKKPRQSKLCDQKLNFYIEFQGHER